MLKLSHILSVLFSVFVLFAQGCYEAPTPPPVDMQFGDKQKFYKDHPGACGRGSFYIRECGF
nr:hypothetical protein [uncultured Helicobacter sp.]